MSASRADNIAFLASTPHAIEPGQKWVVDDFKPEDAPGVARLYFAVYGDSFPVDHVYDPEELIRLNAGPDLHQVVGRTPTGEVVGLYSLFRNPPGRHIMEAGSWMVHPAYRNTSLAMKMARRTHLHPPGRLNLNCIFGQSVCSHVITQKMGLGFGAINTALEIEAMPPKPRELGGGEEGCISLINGTIIYKDQPHAVYLPGQYSGTLGSLYETWGLERGFARDAAPTGRTASSVQTMGGEHLAKMTVQEIGLDFASHLDAMTREYPGRHVYQIVLPLARPGCTAAVDAARRAGFFLAGILPLWFDRDALLMQKVAGEPDASRIRLYAQQDKDFLDLVLADRKSLT